MLGKLQSALIVVVLVMLVAVPVGGLLYGAAAGVAGGACIVLALIALQYPLMRYMTRNLKRDDTEQ